MGNLEYSFDNILKSYIDTGKQLTDHQLNLISSNKGMLKTYLRKRVIAVKKTKGILLDKELELFEKYDKKSYDDYMNYILNLKVLFLKNFKSLPDFIGNLTNLGRLNLSYNELTLTNLEGIKNLTNLKELNLSDNKLTSIEGIENLTNLKKLYLFNNRLTNLEGIEKLTKLVDLDLRYNQLTSLKGIENLTNLKRLSLDGNQLTTLPESIGNLTNLERLNLRNNELESLPKSIGNLKNLENLDLSDNFIYGDALTKIRILFPYGVITF